MTAVESPLVVDNSVVPTRPSSSCSSRSGTHRYRHGTPPPIAPVLGRSEQEIVRISKAILGEVPCGMNQAPTAEDVRDVKDVLYEHWNDVVRLRRHLDFCRNGYIPAVAFCKALSQELAFRKASDVRVLAQIVLGCLIDGESLPPHPLAQRGEGLVDIRLLWKSVQRSFKGTEWKKRFRAAGVMPVSLQRHTTGVEYVIPPHLPPFFSLLVGAMIMFLPTTSLVVTVCIPMKCSLGVLTTRGEPVASAADTVRRFALSQNILKNVKI